MCVKVCWAPTMRKITERVCSPPSTGIIYTDFPHLNVARFQCKQYIHTLDFLEEKNVSLWLVCQSFSGIALLNS